VKRKRSKNWYIPGKSIRGDTQANIKGVNKRTCGGRKKKLARSLWGTKKLRSVKGGLGGKKKRKRVGRKRKTVARGWKPPFKQCRIRGKMNERRWLQKKKGGRRGVLPTGKT